MHKIILLATGLLLGAGAHAADNGIYIGGSVGRASVEVDDLGGLSSADFKGDDTGFKLIAGIRPLDWLGFEVSYVDFGNPDDTVAGTRIETDGDGFSGFGVGFLAVGPVDLFAKVGVLSWDTNIARQNLDGTDLAYGVGAQFRFLSLAVRGEYEVFDIDDLDDANMFSIGLTYTFL